MLNQLSSQLQFVSPSLRTGGIGSSVRSLVGLEDAAQDQHRKMVQRRNLFFNMIRYQNKSKTGV